MCQTFGASDLGEEIGYSGGGLAESVSEAKVTPEIALRPLQREDFDSLAHWLSMPHVAQWWAETPELCAVVAKYEPRLQPDSLTKVFVITIDGRSIGIIQCYRHCDFPEWDRAVGVTRAAGIDYLIGDTDAVGKGIGSAAIREVCRIAWGLFPDIDVIVSVPQRDNRASWRALEKADFERIGERKLDSDCPSDSGISYIYSLRRPFGSY